MEENLFTHLTIVVVPLFLSNIIHMLVIKYNWLAFSAIPIWESAYGKNKTWRGFLVLPLLNGIFLWSFDYLEIIRIEWAFIFGMILGLAYLLFELPNSYFKRKIGIPPGQKHSKYPYLFMLIDKMDSAFGVSTVYYLLGMASLNLCFIIFIAAVLIHIVFSAFFTAVKMKKSF